MYMTPSGGMVTSSNNSSTNARKITGFSIDAIIGTKIDVGSEKLGYKCSNNNGVSRNSVGAVDEDRLGGCILEKGRLGCCDLDSDREGKRYKATQRIPPVKNLFWRPSEGKRNISPISTLPLQVPNADSLTSPRSSSSTSPSSSPASSSLSLSDSLLLYPRKSHSETSLSAGAFSDNKPLLVHTPSVDTSTRTRIVGGDRTSSDSATVGSHARFPNTHISFGELAQLDYRTLSSLGLFQLGLHQESTTAIGACATPQYAQYHHVHQQPAPHGAVPLGYHHAHHLAHLNHTRLPFPGPPFHHALLGGAGREAFHTMPWWSVRHDAFLSGRFSGPEAGLLFQPFRKPKRIRTAFSPSQLLRLEQAFDKNHYVVGQERKDLASKLGLTETQVKVWFQNRRTKHKRIKSEEGSPQSPNDSLEHDDDDDENDDDNSTNDDADVMGNNKRPEAGGGVIWRPEEQLMDGQFIPSCCGRVGLEDRDDADSDEEMNDHDS